MEKITKENLFPDVDFKALTISPDFDEIVLNILPLLKNGITPENQKILGLLENIAEHIGSGCWRFKKQGQIGLFDRTLS